MSISIYTHMLICIHIFSSLHTLMYICEDLYGGWPLKQDTKAELWEPNLKHGDRDLHTHATNPSNKNKVDDLNPPQTTRGRLLVIFLTSVLLFLLIMHWPRSVGVIFQLLILIILLLDSGFRVLLRWVLQSCSLIHSLLASVKWLLLQGWMEVLKGNEHSVTKHRCSTSKAFSGFLTL